MEPTRTLADGETITIGGLEIQAFHHITDTKDTLTFWIPEYKMIVDNVVWPAMNMYTMRGDAYRDPSTWLGALRDIRALDGLFPKVGDGQLIRQRSSAAPQSLP